MSNSQNIKVIYLKNNNDDVKSNYNIMIKHDPYKVKSLFLFHDILNMFYDFHLGKHSLGKADFSGPTKNNSVIRQKVDKDFVQCFGIPIAYINDVRYSDSQEIKYFGDEIKSIYTKVNFMISNSNQLYPGSDKNIDMTSVSGIIDFCMDYLEFLLTIYNYEYLIYTEIQNSELNSYITSKLALLLKKITKKNIIAIEPFNLVSTKQKIKRNTQTTNSTNQTKTTNTIKQQGVKLLQKESNSPPQPSSGSPSMNGSSTSTSAKNLPPPSGSGSKSASAKNSPQRSGSASAKKKHKYKHKHKSQILKKSN